ncbi:MAG: riboflavin synthase [Dehalococcoidales bacterium]|nr:MAG: riboflavin synthase [Dehalococcoidales bacterium]
MFTGIAEEVGRIDYIQPGKLKVRADRVLENMQIGDSINVNGACLTVTRFDDYSFSIDIMPETAKRSNLGQLKVGDGVNLERALTFGGRLGGHLVQGHIDGMGRVASMRWEDNTLMVEFEAPPQVMRYMVEKGFIAVDGLSLTVITREAVSFSVSIVEYTRRNTTIGERRVGDPVNLEADIIAKYVEVLTKPETSGITEDFLREHGFLVG